MSSLAQKVEAGQQREDNEAEGKLSSEVIVLNAYFKDLLDLVPSSIFFDAEASQKINAHRNKQDGLSSGDAHKKSFKKFKFDPEAPTKTSELQKVVPTLLDVATNEVDFPPKKLVVQRGTNGLITQKIPSVTIVNSCDETDGDVEQETIKAKRPKQQSDVSIKKKSSPHESESEDKSGETSGSELLCSRPNPDHLREKLRARIADLQSKRQKGMTAEEFLESKRLRRKESKLKLKQKRKEAKKLKLSVEKQKKNSESKMNGVSEVDPEHSRTNSNKVVFSKFQFSEQARKPKQHKQTKPKSYKELYMKVTQDKEKLEELRKTDSEKAQKTEEKQAWRKAMEMAKGTKVRDNPELLKKSMKKEEKEKHRSQKKWQERVQSVNDQQQKRQEKRKKNIRAKNQSKLDRKIKLAKKKGRFISGF